MKNKRLLSTNLFDNNNNEIFEDDVINIYFDYTKDKNNNIRYMLNKNGESYITAKVIFKDNAFRINVINISYKADDGCKINLNNILSSQFENSIITKEMIKSCVIIDTNKGENNEK